MRINIKKVFVILTSTLLLSNTYATSCRLVNKLENQIQANYERHESLREAIQLNDKLKEVSGWQEYTDIASIGYDSQKAEEIFTAKELDLLLLNDLLVDQVDEHTSEMGYKFTELGGWLGFSFVGMRVINKLLAHGYKAGFMSKVQKFVLDDVDNEDKAKKIRTLARFIMLAAPAYTVYEEVQIYNLLKEAKRKMSVIKSPLDVIPEIEALEDKISSDERKLRMITMNLEQICE